MHCSSSAQSKLGSRPRGVLGQVLQADREAQRVGQVGDGQCRTRGSRASVMGKPGLLLQPSRLSGSMASKPLFTHHCTNRVFMMRHENALLPHVEPLLAGPPVRRAEHRRGELRRVRAEVLVRAHVDVADDLHVRPERVELRHGGRVVRLAVDVVDDVALPGDDVGRVRELRRELPVVVRRRPARRPPPAPVAPAAAVAAGGAALDGRLPAVAACRRAVHAGSGCAALGDRARAASSVRQDRRAVVRAPAARRRPSPETGPPPRPAPPSRPPTPWREARTRGGASGSSRPGRAIRAPPLRKSQPRARCALRQPAVVTRQPAGGIRRSRLPPARPCAIPMGRCPSTTRGRPGSALPASWCATRRCASRWRGDPTPGWGSTWRASRSASARPTTTTSSSPTTPSRATTSSSSPWPAACACATPARPTASSPAACASTTPSCPSTRACARATRSSSSRRPARPSSASRLRRTASGISSGARPACASSSPISSGSPRPT